MKSRRQFLQSSGAALVGASIGFPAITSAKPNSRISVACIGVRGRGNSVMHTFADEADCAITHICDVRTDVRERRSKEMKNKTGFAPKIVNDYRDLLDDKSIDAFMVATPDHWHAMLIIEGCRAGKDVYVEKPASHNILEGKVAVAMARRHGRMVQMGTQARSAAHFKEAQAFARSGALGKLISGKAWETARNREVHLAKDGQAPVNLDYHLWQGPAPERAYNSTIVGGAWRWMFNYGTGDLGNDGVHRIDYVRAMLGVAGMPEAVTCSGGKFFFKDDQQWPDTQFVTYEFPGKVIQYEMRLWSRPKLHDATEGAVIYGENGWMMVTHTWWKAWDAKGKLLKEGRGDTGQVAHVRNFLDAIKSRKRGSLNQEIYSGHVASSMCHMGNIAWRTGKKLRFDARTETFDDAEANKLVGREHRKGFELPEV
jgi:predicted dehydrogenase